MRVGLVVRGVVQGVGFRPFVHRTASARGLTGWVKNGRAGVRIEVQGQEEAVVDFARVLEHELPPPAEIGSITRETLADLDVDASTSFCILPSDASANETIALVIPPDLATCDACTADVRRAGGRRFAYPFTNCASCGPRYSIVRAVPYDRRSTTMAGFTMCADCGAEYEDLSDRRHHAQPIACPVCGPQLAWIAADGALVSTNDAALRDAAAAIAGGLIVALRGIGGFQLVCDATSPDAVARIRRRKDRPRKPLAVMFADAAAVGRSAVLSAEERAVLASGAAPIVLLARRPDAEIAAGIAPGRSDLGAMLPNTPLHQLLADAVGRPIVCTSGNRSEEPLAIDNEEAFERLAGIADAFLTHDRPIARPIDDSVVRVGRHGPAVIRRARGYAPQRVATIDERVTVLGVGAHLKSTVTLGHRGALVPSQHIGDLDSARSRELLVRTAEDLTLFFEARPAIVACDLHPDYASTAIAEDLARRWGAELVRIQHHHAHVAAVMAERGLAGPVLGLAWDGTGLGTDGTIWGGEALVCRGTTAWRFAHVRPFPLPGGDRAARDPRRCAIGLLADARPEALSSYARAWFDAAAPLHLSALERRIGAPSCSSIGRLFDAIAALAGLVEPSTYEGETAIALEELATERAQALGHRTVREEASPYPFPLDAEGVADTRPLVGAVLADAQRGAPRARIAQRFHQALVELGVEIARRAAIPDVVLSGGCFQNRFLAERLERRLAEAGFSVHTPAAVPTNDGAISVGQAWLAARRAARK